MYRVPHHKLWVLCISGNQFNSSSDARAYGKLIRKGVRCLEIDLWDDEDMKTPKVTHGNTNCTNIKLEDVLKEIEANVGKIWKFRENSNLTFNGFYDQ